MNKEYKIGEHFFVDDTELEVVSVFGEICDRCFFFEDANRCEDVNHSCISKYRSDKNNVIFKEVCRVKNIEV